MHHLGQHLCVFLFVYKYLGIDSLGGKRKGRKEREEISDLWCWLISVVQTFPPSLNWVHGPGHWDRAGKLHTPPPAAPLRCPATQSSSFFSSRFQFSHWTWCSYNPTFFILISQHVSLRLSTQSWLCLITRVGFLPCSPHSNVHCKRGGALSIWLITELLEYLSIWYKRNKMCCIKDWESGEGKYKRLFLWPLMLVIIQVVMFMSRR